MNKFINLTAMILTGDFLVGVLLLDEALDEDADDDVEPGTSKKATLMKDYYPPASEASRGDY